MIRKIAFALGLSLTTLIPAPILAIGLGDIEVKSGLGDRLLARVPVFLNNNEEILGCVDTKSPMPGENDPMPNDAMPNDAIPYVTRVKSAVIESNQQTYIQLTSAQPLDEPLMRVVISIGCKLAVVRSYDLLLDPPLQNWSNAQANPASLQSLPHATPRKFPSPGSPTQPRPSAGNSTGKRVAEAVALPATRASKTGRLQNADRLKLSSDLDSTALQFARELSNLEVAPTADPVRLTMMRGERDRLIALLNGQNPDTDNLAREAALQKKMTALTQETMQLRQQIKSLNQSVLTLKQTSTAKLWVWFCAIVAALAIFTCLGLVWYCKKLSSSMVNKPWWIDQELEANTPPLRQKTTTATTPAAPSAQPSLDIKTDTGMSVVEETIGALQPFQTHVTNPPTIPQVLQPTSQTVAQAEPPPVLTHPIIDTIPIAAMRKIEKSAAPISISAANMVSNFHSSSASPKPSKPIQQQALHTPASTTEVFKKPVLFDLELPPVSSSPEPAKSVNASTARSTPGSLMPIDLPGGSAIRDKTENAQLFTDVNLHHPDSAEHSASQLMPERLTQFAAVIEQVQQLMDAQENTKAITLLRTYVLRDENIPTLMWLKLFVLYQRVDKQSVYEALSEHFVRRYHRSMVKWNGDICEKTDQVGLQSRPDLQELLQKQQGTRQGIEALNHLICGHDQPDEIVFNAVLQHDLLMLAKNYTLHNHSQSKVT